GVEDDAALLEMNADILFELVEAVARNGSGHSVFALAASTKLERSMKGLRVSTTTGTTPAGTSPDRCCARLANTRCSASSSAALNSTATTAPAGTAAAGSANRPRSTSTSSWPGSAVRGPSIATSCAVSVPFDVTSLEPTKIRKPRGLPVKLANRLAP